MDKTPFVPAHIGFPAFIVGLPATFSRGHPDLQIALFVVGRVATKMRFPENYHATVDQFMMTANEVDLSDNPEIVALIKTLEGRSDADAALDSQPLIHEIVMWTMNSITINGPQASIQLQVLLAMLAAFHIPTEALGVVIGCVNVVSVQIDMGANKKRADAMVSGLVRRFATESATFEVLTDEEVERAFDGQHGLPPPPIHAGHQGAPNGSTEPLSTDN